MCVFLTKFLSVSVRMYGEPSRSTDFTMEIGEYDGIYLDILFQIYGISKVPLVMHGQKWSIISFILLNLDRHH